MALETAAQQVRDRHAEGLVIVRELLATVGAFPGRLRLIEPLVYFYAEFNRLVIAWCEATPTKIPSS